WTRSLPASRTCWPAPSAGSPDPDPDLGTGHRVASTESAAGGGDAQRGAERGDDRTADGDRQERPAEAGVEELVPQPGQDQQLAGDHGDGRADGGAVAGDEERQGVEDAAGEGPAAGDRAAQHGPAAPGQVAGV